MVFLTWIEGLNPICCVADWVHSTHAGGGYCDRHGSSSKTTATVVMWAAIPIFWIKAGDSKYGNNILSNVQLFAKQVVSVIFKALIVCRKSQIVFNLIFVWRQKQCIKLHLFETRCFVYWRQPSGYWLPVMITKVNTDIIASKHR
jgi:hypothetical protein